MIINKIGFVLSDTSRSRAYIQLLINENLIPSNFIVLDPGLKDEKILLGKPKKIKKELLDISYLGIEKKISFNPNTSIFETMQKFKINFKLIKSKSINEKEVIEFIKKTKQKYFIYSGFGGIILKDEILGIGKKFIHIHGGFLPKYRGSTCNYYSILNENKIGAASIIMKKKIDEGPIICSRKFKAPKMKHKIDHLYDPLTRAYVLIETIKKFVENNNLNEEKNVVELGTTYYIIHPLLKHFSILK